MWMSEYFPEPKSSRKIVKLELDLSNYAAKADLKNPTCGDTWKFAKKVYLSSLKSNVDKLDIDKLKNVPTNLSNLESEGNQLEVNKWVPGSVDLTKLRNAVKKLSC